MKWTSWLAGAVLLAFAAFIVCSSLRVGGVRCEVCIDFEGRSACRAVDGATQQDALTAAHANTCALLAAGVTQTMACERTPATSTNCHPQ